MKMKIVVHVYSHSADQRDQKDVMPWCMDAVREAAVGWRATSPADQ